MDPALQRLVDQAAIRDLQYRYCRGVDRLVWDLIRSCYHPDAIDDHGVFKGSVDELIAWGRTALTEFENTTHFTGNQLVEVDGDVAWAEHYAIARHRRPAGAEGPAVDPCYLRR